jgi:hypothetical protein
MGRVKERYFEILEYAQQCCAEEDDYLLSYAVFKQKYPNNIEIFDQEWLNRNSLISF